MNPGEDRETDGRSEEEDPRDAGGGRERARILPGGREPDRQDDPQNHAGHERRGGPRGHPLFLHRHVSGDDQEQGEKGDRGGPRHLRQQAVSDHGNGRGCQSHCKHHQACNQEQGEKGDRDGPPRTQTVARQRYVRNTRSSVPSNQRSTTSLPCMSA